MSKEKGMPKVNDNEWDEYVWNPVSGCFHDCRKTYCYNTMKKLWLNRNGARVHVSNVRPNDVTEQDVYKNPNFRCIRDWKSRERGTIYDVSKNIAKPDEVYPYGYDPTFYPHRLQQPTEKKHPPGIKVFVVDVGDLFGDWIDDKWIEQILDVVRECERLHYKYIFHFLTKNPKRYHKFRLPDNVWIGTSIDDNATAVQRYNDLIGYNNSNVKRFISFEPLLEDINMNSISLDKIHWVMIGADSRYNAHKPPRQYADRIVNQARNRNIPIFIKDNYSNYPKEQIVKDFPSRDSGVKTMHISKFDFRYKDIFKVDPVIRKQIRNNIEAKIKKQGFDGITPIDVWRNHIIMGHVRVEIAKELGFKEVPVEKHEFKSEAEAFDHVEAKLPPSIKLIRP